MFNFYKLTLSMPMTYMPFWPFILALPMTTRSRFGPFVLALPMTNPRRLIWLSWHCQWRLGAVTQLPPASIDRVILNGQNDERGGGGNLGSFFMGEGKGDERQNSFWTSRRRGQRCPLLRNSFPYFFSFLPFFSYFQARKRLGCGKPFQENRPAWKGLNATC